MKRHSLQKWIAIFFLVLLVNTAYIAAFSSATVFYMGNVLLHLVLGTVLSLAVIFTINKRKEIVAGAPVAVGFLLLAFVLGLVLTWKGNVYANLWLLISHIVAAGIGVLALIPFVWKKASEAARSVADDGWLQFRQGFTIAALLLFVLPPLSIGYRKAFPDKHNRITNPRSAPIAMEGEGGGPKSPFFPSSAKTNVGGIIPSNFFMDSATCGECHKQIYAEWKSSSHHFASFNNQFYRKAIENMQDTQGTTHGSKWCAGCHDHAVFFNGKFDKPMKEQVDTAEAHAGLACTSCHAITHVDSTMGNGGFTIEYPALHQLMTSKNPIIRTSVDFMTYLNPEPHRETFMKPFMTAQSSEFCSGCHKVHLDVPVNNYRWFRGFDDYDNWQASGFGEGARSFYYPKAGKTCTGCHMPAEPSTELGSKNGEGHSHRFAAANTSLSHANLDEKQTAAEQKFLTSGFISVDIFAASPVKDDGRQTNMVRRAATGPQLSSGIGAGEEVEQSGDTFIREVGEVAAPLDVAKPKLVPGTTARVDVVVRTRAIGHSFPGGTLDSFDIWLELQATDATGKIIYWNGKVADEGKGAVDPGAHMYKAFQVDGEGNEINKRNAYQARSVLYVHSIPPGAADTVHYLLKIPKDAQGPITLTAKLNHRKFSWYYTNFAYAGQPKPGQDPKLNTINYNSLDYSFDKSNIPANVSGEIRGEVPVTPITVLASATSTIDLTNNPSETKWEPVAAKKLRERWNDWGIGLLLQGDVKGAEYAFTKVTEAEPGYADGWLNRARALIQEGETEAAKPMIRKALEADSSLGRIWYFKALIEKADGDYDAALKSLAVVTAKYPRDRVVWNQIGRLLFLKRQYKDSIDALQKVNAIDPEDLQMHYTAMLSYRGLGDVADADREQKLFQRFKAEESAQSITAKRRLVSPEDNNERQAIHDHETMPLGNLKPAVAPGTSVRKSEAAPAKTASAQPAHKSSENAGGN
ncbi:MAG TPA: tetratricopeptide repeat protein [Bryobacteraceae bacterium]|jgi:tetratricopeptide (TPR) repeat protein|nr:tetratricopeptide repeat protein [Bryobacteraceae bacterium]